tara:strand:+ start:2740 stop:3150 length:411 start_codon:yes stop_codon:yes gene_type:complete
MKFKVTAKTVSTISVEFEDGSYAVVPIAKDLSKEDIIAIARTYHKANVDEQAFSKVADVPLEVSDTWIEWEEPIQDYRAARQYHYPNMGKQLDALYWARQGDDTQLKAVDATIKLVKEKIPKGTSYKGSEIEGLLD